MSLRNEERGHLIATAETRAREASMFWEREYYKRLRDFDDYYHVRLPKILEEELADDERSDLVPPDVHLLTNNFRAQFLLPFWRTRKIATLLGRGPQDVRNESFAQKLFDWSLEVTDRWRQLDLDAHSIATKGFAVGMTENRPILDRRLSPQGEVIETPLFGGAPIPHYVHLEALRFFPDPQARRLTWPECRYVVYEADMTKEALYHERAKSPREWVFTDSEINQIWGPSVTNQTIQKLKMEKYYELQVSPNDVVTVQWYVGDITHPNRPTEFRQAIVGVANRQLLFFATPSTSKPLVEYFHMMGINPEDDRLLSMGKIEAVEDVFLELYTKLNQQIDLANIGGYGMAFVQRGSGLPEATRVGPYTWVEVDNPLDLQTSHGEHNSDLAIGAIGARNQLRDAYGSNYALGLNPQERESATGANILVEQQSTQNLQVVIHAWNTGLGPESQTRLDLLQEYAPDEVWVRVSEDKLAPMQRITREQIAGQFDFSLAVGVDDFQPQAVRQARMERMVAMYRGDPDIDQLELKRRHLQVMGFNDAELLIVGTDEKEGWARSENAVILQYGVKMPLWGGEDHMVHARIHLQGIISALELAHQNMIRGENVEALLDHYQLHLIELQATQGLQGDQGQIVGAGLGGVGQARASLGPALDGASEGPQNRIDATRSMAQLTANAHGTFQ